MLMFHTYSLNLVIMNKLVKLKNKSKLEMQNDENYAIFLEDKKNLINSWKYGLWPSSFLKIW
jgi:hypothetical protein